MSNLLAARIAQDDLKDLPEWQVAQILNAPDPALPYVPTVFSCRAISAPAAISGELGMLRVIQRKGEIPADISPTGQAVPISTIGLAAIESLLGAVEEDRIVDPNTPGSSQKVLEMLSAVQQIGLLSEETINLILAGTVRQQSWAEANQIEVTALSVSQAKGV